MQMGLVGMHTTVRDQAKKMQPAAARAGVFHGREQRWIGEELSVLNQELDAGAVHMDDPAGTDVEMADFAVSHLAVGQPDGMPAGLNQRVRILPQPTVISGLAG